MIFLIFFLCHKLCNYVQKNLQFPGHHLEAESDGEWMTNS